MAWFDSYPGARLRGFIDAMPAIIAEERLAYIKDTACGSGVLKKGVSGKHQRMLAREASTGERVTKAGKFGKALLESYGIQVG